MKTFVFLFALLGVAGTASAAVPTHASVGKGHGIDLPSRDANCWGTLAMNYDGSAENGFGWQYGGVAPPYYGAFAECFDAPSGIDGMVLKLTGDGHPCQPCDIYYWCDAGGMPGCVLAMYPGYNPCPVATWPSVSTHEICCGAPSGGMVWAGYWADFSSQVCGYYIAADTNGFGGCPMTNIAPGIGYPTGWNSARVVWGPVQAIGIGVWLDSLGGIGCIQPPPDSSVPPARGETSTWGRIKSMNL